MRVWMCVGVGVVAVLVGGFLVVGCVEHLCFL